MKPRRSVTLAHALHPKDNALNFLRLVLALTVVVSHAFPVGGFGPDPTWGGLKLGTAAVGGFFVISGYLITRSKERLGLRPYAIARALRIFPALWICLLVTAFLIAPLMAVRNGGWSVSVAVNYVLRNVIFRDPLNTIGAVTQPNPLNAVNGSLWTLRYELACYIMVALVGSFAVYWRHRVIALLASVRAIAVSVLLLDVRNVPSGLIHDLAFLVDGARRNSPGALIEFPHPGRVSL